MAAVFQSTRPIRGATKAVQQRGVHGIISIHAPHTGRDASISSANSITAFDFNPRAPYGARLCQLPHSVVTDAISIHAPHTGRDVPFKINQLGCSAFQSTRPIRGATITVYIKLTPIHNFNPRAPYGARHQLPYHHQYGLEFQSTRPIRGATGLSFVALFWLSDFNPRAPYGARLNNNVKVSIHIRFQSTRPIRGATAKMHNLCSAFLQQQTIKA